MHMSSLAQRGPLHCDPRTKLAFTLTVGCFCLTSAGGTAPAMQWVRWLLSAAAFVLLACSGRVRQALCMAVFAGMCIGVARLAVTWQGSFAWLSTMSVAMWMQMLPSGVAAYWLMATTTASELTTALQRWHVPQAITIPLAVIFRFFPTATQEQRAIRDAMRMRGVRVRGRKARLMLEYRIVPLVANVVRIGDELTQAALTRGLGERRDRTSIAKVGFGAFDILMFAGCAACYALWALTAAGVVR
ncbi:energy-coupling factor transporter transmembrane component T [Pseudoscardovia suis]|uniref:Cobalt transport protein n=1 Tax=Pseudoscardovia suis TaxID=987063 RepID=A0A261EYG9_9BIFI|nr:energy-coupling factor transporter transmembrane component T [Pseudoscardovia suis]OZG51888.1 Cobalt transport protein [Pseudoscardovia suis]PJJ69513.1 energy-coupling factor transport system permease protein [Pseudoscardovia suis]